MIFVRQGAAEGYGDAGFGVRAQVEREFSGQTQGWSDVVHGSKFTVKIIVGLAAALRSWRKASKTRKIVGGQ